MRTMPVHAEAAAALRTILDRDKAIPIEIAREFECIRDFLNGTAIERAIHALTLALVAATPDEAWQLKKALVLMADLQSERETVVEEALAARSPN